MATSDKILAELGRTNERLNSLYDLLYGVEGHPQDKGDIPRLLSQLERINGQVRTNTMFRKISTWLSGAIFVGLISLLVAVLSG